MLNDGTTVAPQRVDVLKFSEEIATSLIRDYSATDQNTFLIDLFTKIRDVRIVQIQQREKELEQLKETYQALL